MLKRFNFSIKILVFSASVLIAAGCAPPSRVTSQEAPGLTNKVGLTQRMWWSNSKVGTLIVQIENSSEKSVLIDTYFFGFQLEAVDTSGIRRIFDFGADKVPAPTLLDWQVLKPGQSLSWIVEPRSSFPLDPDDKVRYFQSNIRSDFPENFLKLEVLNPVPLTFELSKRQN